MTSLALKIIAMVTMTIDHVGKGFIDNNFIFRFIGRMAFPLYGFMIVEGFNHTKNDKKRFIRYFCSILLLAICSEVIYDLYFHNSYFSLKDQNILFTLSVSLLCMLIYEKNSNTIMNKIISLYIIFHIGIISELLNFNYGFLGILLIFGFYLVSRFNSNYKKLLYLLVFIIYLLLHRMFSHDNIIFGVLLSIIPILLYNGKKGYSSYILKYFFYAYYPLHLLVLYILKM